MKRMKPLFLSENEALKDELCRQGFHPALCNHPSILFGERKKGEEMEKTCLLRLKVYFFKKCIKIGLLNEAKFWLEDALFPIIPYHLPKVEKPKGKLAVYSVLTGDYDDVHEMLYKEDGVDFLLFTNNPSLKSKTWQVVMVESDLDDVLLSREIKMFPEKFLGSYYDMSIYVDAKIEIYGELSELTRYLGVGKSFAVSRHGQRNNVKEEIEACVNMKGVDKNLAQKQYERYIQEGFHDDPPLLECGCLVRRHDDRELWRLMQAWFEEFKGGIRRDQLSLMPCVSRLHFKGLVVMDGNVWHNQFFKI